jgi:hypothetical protein
MASGYKMDEIDRIKYKDIEGRRNKYKDYYDDFSKKAVQNIFSGSKGKDIGRPIAGAAVFGLAHKIQQHRHRKDYKEFVGQQRQKAENFRAQQEAEKASRIRDREEKLALAREKFDISQKEKANRMESREKSLAEKKAYQSAMLKLRERNMYEKRAREHKRDVEKEHNKMFKLYEQDRLRGERRQEKLTNEINRGYTSKIKDPREREEFLRNPEAAKSRLVEHKRAWFNPVNLKTGSRSAGFRLAPEAQQAVQRADFRDTDPDKIDFLKKRGYNV